ncbi:unnamed protein product, partial [Discosporangium mesarthrocarpum]
MKEMKKNDKNDGRKLFEKTGQHRWVEYADIHNYDSSTIPSSWHPWLHHMSDSTP